MKNMSQKDYINIFVLIILFLLMLFSIVGFKYVNGSTIDWDSQHWIIPEYFRNLFYDTKDIFPSFAFNIGGGENIYNLSYYGFLSPLILLSYLCPNVLMVDYIQIIMIAVVITSIILMYYWLKCRFDTKYAFIGTLLFLLSAPIIYHTHRHIMFINYMPFLLMGLIGVDKYFDKNKKVLLVISVLLMIMTSYYYSVGGLITILLYGIYKYIEINEKIVIKHFLKAMLKFILLLLVGVLMSSVLILPTFYALLNGRSDITANVNIFKLLIPTLNLNEILYNAYSLGVTSILFFGIVFGLLCSKKENKYLSVIFILLIVFPVITYSLSGFMYVRGKVLIPFLPLAILLITISLDGITVRKNFKFLVLFIIVSITQIVYFVYLKEYIFVLDVLILFITYLIYKKKGNKNVIIIPLCICSLLCCIVNNYTDKLATKEEISSQHDTHNYSILSNLINEEESVYRVANQMLEEKNANRVVDTEYYLPSIYSSLINKNYYNFSNNLIGSEMSNRISTAILPTRNILYNTYMGMKYIITDGNASIGYANIKDSNVYVNGDVFPIGYSTSDVLSKKNYNELQYPDNIYALMSNIVVDENVESEFNSEIKEEPLEYEVELKTVTITEENDKYIINSEHGKLVLNLNKTYKDKILFISLDMGYSESCAVGDTSITINGVKNTLSCKDWIYHNKNYNFTYVISSNEAISKLNIEFSKGKYEISNIHMYSLDYDYIKDSVNKVDEFKINKELTKGDNIVGDINVTENGYFMLTVPYDNGFNIYLDDKLIPYKKVDNAFMGFPINEGYHTIKIVYVSPYLFEGLILSVFGYMIFLPIIYSDVRRKKK